MDPENVSAKFEVRSFTRSLDNRGYPKNWAFSDYAHAPFFKSFNGLLFGWTLRIYLPNLKSVALPIPEIIAIAVLGGGCKPLILGKERPYGVRMVPFKRALVSSYRPP